MNCGGYVAKVTPELNAAEGICSWTVDINNPNKILTVETDLLSKEQVMNFVKRQDLRLKNYNEKTVG